jgi:hypothetical protein
MASSAGLRAKSQDQVLLREEKAPKVVITSAWTRRRTEDPAGKTLLVYLTIRPSTQMEEAERRTSSGDPDEDKTKTLPTAV